MFGWWKKKSAPAPDVVEAVSEVSRKIGDVVDGGAAFIIDRPYGEKQTFSIAEGGVVTWVGGQKEFCALIRSAARSATQVAEAA